MKKILALFFIVILKVIDVENLVNKNPAIISEQRLLPDQWMENHSFGGSVDSQLSDSGNFSVRRGLAPPEEFEPLEPVGGNINKNEFPVERIDELTVENYNWAYAEIEPAILDSENILISKYVDSNESDLLDLENYPYKITGSKYTVTGRVFSSQSQVYNESLLDESFDNSPEETISKRIMHLEDHYISSTPVAIEFQLRQPLLERTAMDEDSFASHKNISLNEERIIPDEEALDLLESLSHHNINIENCPVTKLSESACSDLIFLSNIYKKPILNVDSNVTVQNFIRNSEDEFFFSSVSLSDLWQNHLNFDGHLNLEIVDTTYEQLVDYYEAPIDPNFVLPKMSILDKPFASVQGEQRRIQTVNRGPLPYEWDNVYNFYGTQGSDMNASEMKLPTSDHSSTGSAIGNLKYDNIGPRIVLHAPPEFPTDALVEAMSQALPNVYQKASKRIDDSSNFPSNINYPFQIQTPISTQEQLHAPQSYPSLQATTPSLFRSDDNSDIKVEEGDLSSKGKTRFVIRLRKHRDDLGDEETGEASSSNGNESNVTEVKLKNGKRFRVRIRRKKDEEQQEFSETKNSPIQFKKIPTMKASGSFPMKSSGYPPAKSPGYPPVKSQGYPIKPPVNLKPSLNLGSLKNKIPGFMGGLDGLFGKLGSVFSKNMNDAYGSTNGFLKNVFGGVKPDVYYENILTIVAIASFLAFVYLRGLSMINTLAALNLGKTDNLLAIVKEENQSEISSILTSIQDRIGRWTGLDKSNIQQPQKKQDSLDTAKLLKKTLNVSEEHVEEPFKGYVDRKNFVRQIDDTAKIGAILIDAALELKLSGDNTNDSSCLARPLCEINKKSTFSNGIQRLIVPILSTFVQWLVISPSDVFSSLEVLRPLWLSEGSSESCSRILSCSNNMTSRLLHTFQ